MSLDNKTLALEMTAINMVNSQELAENSRIVSDIIDLQNQVKEKMGTVADVKDIISEMKDHEVNPDTAVILDKQLERQGAMKSLLVSGAESLGRDISPNQWRMDRIKSCESFISEMTDFLEQSTKRLLSSFQDAKVTLTMSIKDSKKALEALKEEVNGVGAWSEDESLKVDLGYTLFNHFKVNGELPKSLEEEFSRLTNTVRALTLIYYKENSDGLNDLFRLFGGVSICKTPKDVETFLLNIPYSLKHRRFNACSIDEGKQDSVHTYRSPALMGDRYFTSNVVSPKDFPKTLDGFSAWLNVFSNNAGVTFSGLPERVVSGTFQTNALDKSTILLLIKRMYETVESWEKTYDIGDREIMSVKEMKNSFDELRSLDAESKHIDALCDSFQRLVLHNQRELLTIRSSITKYIALEITALIQLARLSIATREE